MGVRWRKSSVLIRFARQYQLIARPDQDLACAGRWLQAHRRHWMRCQAWTYTTTKADAVGMIREEGARRGERATLGTQGHGHGHEAWWRKQSMLPCKNCSEVDHLVISWRAVRGLGQLLLSMTFWHFSTVKLVNSPVNSEPGEEEAGGPGNNINRKDVWLGEY